ncbi:MAG: hypothetical protein LBN95_12185 [Prevotellaceae bacterium]|nr:hypothetical protein [Prevotellaceae bacterium]
MDLIHWISEINDISILNSIMELKNNAFISSPAEKEAIEQGYSDYLSGNVKLHSQVRKRYEKYL